MSKYADHFFLGGLAFLVALGVAWMVTASARTVLDSWSSRPPISATRLRNDQDSARTYFQPGVRTELLSEQSGPDHFRVYRVTDGPRICILVVNASPTLALSCDPGALPGVTP